MNSVKSSKNLTSSVPSIKLSFKSDMLNNNGLNDDPWGIPLKICPLCDTCSDDMSLILLFLIRIPI